MTTRETTRRDTEGSVTVLEDLRRTIRWGSFGILLERRAIHSCLALEAPLAFMALPAGLRLSCRSRRTGLLCQWLKVSTRSVSKKSSIEQEKKSERTQKT